MFSTVMQSSRPGGLFDRYRKVVETGEPLSEEFPVTQGQLNATWVRYQVVKLGDGLAITCSDISESKATQERYEHLVEFTDSVFQNAPFSIVATDTRGLITAMNVAAEKLTGYHREDLVGKAPLTILHDEHELVTKAWDGDPESTSVRDGFDILTAGVAAGEMEETEWTLIRRDGTRTPINLAVRAVTSDAGEILGALPSAQHRHHRKRADAGLRDSSGYARSTNRTAGPCAAARPDSRSGRTRATLRNEGCGLYARS